MKAPKEMRQHINRLKSKYAKKNGKLPRWTFDHPWYEMFDDRNKQRYDRKKEKRIPDEYS